MGKIIIRETDFLTALRLVDTSRRIVETREVVEITCPCGVIGKTQFGNILTKHKKGLPGWRCPSCVNKGISEKQSLKVGELNPFFGKKHSEKTKQRIKDTRPQAIEKAIETNQKKYGSDWSAQSAEIQAKTKETNREKHGSDWYMGSKEFQEKTKAAVAEKYGVENVRQSPEIKERARQTSLKRYGTDSYSKSDEFKKKISGENHHSKKERHRLKYANLHLSTGEYIADLCKAKGLEISNGIRAFNNYGEAGFRAWLDKVDRYSNAFEASCLSLFQEAGLEVVRWNKQPLEADLKYRPDFRIETGGHPIYINVDGLYYHSEKHREAHYHFDMRAKFEGAGIRLFQFMADELRDKDEIILSMLRNATGRCRRIYARECKFSRVAAEVGRKFFCDNHLMGSHNTATNYGLFIDGEMVACMSVRRSKKSLEISRFASLKNTAVIGGFTKLIENVLLLYADVESVVSFCDLRYSSGRSYETVGFERLGTTLGFYWTDGVNRYNRLRCRANMDERGLSEAEHAAELKIYRIYDAGQAKYIKYLQK